MSERTPDDEAQERILRGAIVLELQLASRNALALTERMLREGGVDPSDYRFLSVIGVLQPVTRTTLVRATGMQRTTLRDAIRPLIERGHVRETPHPEDGRAGLLTLTPKGQAIFDRGLPIFKRVIAAIDEALGGRLDELEEAVWTVRVAVQRLAAGDAPSAEPEQGISTRGTR